MVLSFKTLKPGLYLFFRGKFYTLCLIPDILLSFLSLGSVPRLVQQYDQALLHSSSSSITAWRMTVGIIPKQSSLAFAISFACQNISGRFLSKLTAAIRVPKSSLHTVVCVAQHPFVNISASPTPASSLTQTIIPSVHGCNNSSPRVNHLTGMRPLDPMVTMQSDHSTCPCTSLRAFTHVPFRVQGLNMASMTAPPSRLSMVSSGKSNRFPAPPGYPYDTLFSFVFLLP